jgi:preprotein translocase subunit SecA
LAAEGLPVTAENSSLAKITRQRFFRHYEILGGMTGTATGCEKEFASVYGLAVCSIPLRTDSRRRIEPMKLCGCQASKYEAIAHETQQLHQSGRAVLIGTLNIAQSQAIADELTSRSISFEILNGIQDAEEASIIARAGSQGAVTVATNLAGRGTDIKLDPFVRESGGLHVIVTDHHALSRVDRQLIGRCARCGDPGSARFYLSPDDDLFRHQAPWIARAIRRNAQEPLIDSHLVKQIGRLQNEMESTARSVRWQMLQIDRENESLLKPRESLIGCCQI